MKPSRVRMWLGMVEGSSIWQASPQELQARLEAQPAIASAEVRRYLPDRLKVTVRERRPRAVLRTESGYFLIDQTGAVQVASRNFKSRVYTVPIKGFVTVRDDGNLSMRLCVRPERFLPGREAVLAHKLFIEADEEAYVQSATVVWRAVAFGN